MHEKNATGTQEVKDLFTPGWLIYAVLEMRLKWKGTGLTRHEKNEGFRKDARSLLSLFPVPSRDVVMDVDGQKSKEAGTSTRREEQAKANGGATTNGGGGGVPVASSSSSTLVGTSMSMDTDQPPPQAQPLSPSLKRTRTHAASSPHQNDEGEEDGPATTKKPRMATPEPVVLDSVEIEAKREVAASAGLTGGAEEGSKLELRHQVGAYTLLPFTCPNQRIDVSHR